VGRCRCGMRTESGRWVNCRSGGCGEDACAGTGGTLAGAIPRRTPPSTLPGGGEGGREGGRERGREGGTRNVFQFGRKEGGEEKRRNVRAYRLDGAGASGGAGGGEVAAGTVWGKSSLPPPANAPTRSPSRRAQPCHRYGRPGEGARRKGRIRRNQGPAT